RVRCFAQAREYVRGQRMHATLALHGLDDDRRRARRIERGVQCCRVAWIDEPDARHQRRERGLHRGPIRGRECAEQTTVEAVAKSHDLVLRLTAARARPAARELERRLRRLRARVAEEDAVGKARIDEHLRERRCGLGAVQVREMDQPGGKGPLQRGTHRRITIAEGVDADPCNEVEVRTTGVVVDTNAFATHEDGGRRPIRSEQRSIRDGSRALFHHRCRHAHAASTAVAPTSVPASEFTRAAMLPIRTWATPRASASSAARSFTAMPPPPAAPPAGSDSPCPGARALRVIPAASRTPPTPVTNSSSRAPIATATAHATSSAFTFSATPPGPREIGAITGTIPAPISIES